MKKLILILFFGICIFFSCKNSSNKPVRWKVGDQLEVQWKNSWYKATVLEAKDNNCKIHYEGFTEKWDEWVGETRMRPIN
jgi:hypothetical protein